MKIELFAMERMQSTYENAVDYNLSESGVHPMTLGELLTRPDEIDALLSQELGYTQSNGTVALREAIATQYAGATIDHVQVTNGGSEANSRVASARGCGSGRYGRSKADAAGRLTSTSCGRWSRIARS
jgi:aspartate/methionine/tyrosine aminotransferase